MFIIAGAGHPKSEKFISGKIKHCFHCNNDAYRIFKKTKYHITLFFLPVASYKTEYLFYCSICGDTTKLGKNEFELKVRTETRPYRQS